MAGTTDQPGPPEEEIPTLRRKLGSARSGQPGPQRRSLAWTLRFSIARCAAELCGLPLAAIDASQCSEGPDGLSEYLSDEGLLVLLDGPDGQIGAVCLDFATVSALIQQQTLGNVFDPAENVRPLTDTDAAMVAPLIDRTLQQAAERSETGRDRQIIDGYRFGARVGDVRTLLLALGREDYRVVELLLDISLGQAQGRLCFLLPEIPDPAEHANPMDKEDSSGLSLQDSVGVMRAELTAVIGRLSLPLTQLSQLTSGDLLVLPGGLTDAELIAIDGRLVARAQLGQASGARAVRLFGMGIPSEMSEHTSEEFSTHSTLPIEDGRPVAGAQSMKTPAEERVSGPDEPASRPVDGIPGAGAVAVEDSGLEPVSGLQAEGATQPDPAAAPNPNTSESRTAETSAVFKRNLPAASDPG